MNTSTKPNNPDELLLIDRQFSWLTTWKVCRWLFLATVISVVCDWIYPTKIKQWPFGWRMAVVLAEFVPLLLWVRDAAKWIRGMDELQRRITLASLFFAASASLFILLLWLRLDKERFFHTVFGPPFMNNTWGIYSVADVYLLLSGFYGIGYLIFKRRYK